MRIHFACGFLYTYPGEDAARLRELLQGIVRVGRDADDPLADERIFVLTSGWPPKLDVDPRPQPARHREMLTRMTSEAADNRRAATAAQARADARLNTEGMPPPEGEEDLSDPLQSLLAWNKLEAEDNASAQHAIKFVELCKLPTRAWSVQQMEDLSEEEKEDLGQFEDELKENGATARLATEDGRVGAMSHAEQYDWLLGELERAAEAKGTTLAHEQMAFIAEQEALHSSQQARPEKDCRAQAREAVYEVVRHFTPTAYDVDAPWPTDGAEYAKLRTCIDQLHRRAMLSAIPPSELEVIHEAQRRKGGTAHAQVMTPPYQMRQLLGEFADELGVSIEWLLVPSTFKPTCQQPTADGLLSGQCCGACDESCHEWLRWHNRLRAKVGTEAQKQRDAERLRRLLAIAQKVGAKVTKQMLPLTIVTRVLSDVLALAPPKDGEQKVPVEAAHTRCLQVLKHWVVGDAYAERVGAIQLPMLHPETKELLSVRAYDWVDKFEQLTGDVMSEAGDFDALISDAEDEPEDEVMGEAATDSGGSVAARVSDPKRKTFKVDTTRLLALNSKLEADAETVATTKEAISKRLSEQLNGDADLKALLKDLTRHASLRAVVRGVLERCEGLPVDANGWVVLCDTYSYRGTGGRRYVDAAALPRVDGETEWRTATLQGGHSDLRAVCCGEQAFYIDCENGYPRNLVSLAEQTALLHLVSTWIDYVENRTTWIDEICEVHGCDASVAKRLPNVVGNGGSYYTWLRDNDLKPPAEGSKAFEGKKCKAFLPPKKCRRGEPNATRELEAIRAELFELSRFKPMVEQAERERLVRERLKPRRKHDASLWSRIMQTSEDQVLSIIDRALFDRGWDVFALIFDGFIAAPSAACTEPDVNKALAAAQAACERVGWKVVLALKPLHGLQDEEPKTIKNARAAIEAWVCLQAAAAEDF